MTIFKIYKMELYKMLKRKTSFILMLPSILAIIVGIALKSGGLKITSTKTVYSCMDYTLGIWTILTSIGIVGIFFILVSAFQWSSEVEHGQIKILMLRVGRRSNILIGKFIAMITSIALSIAMFIIVNIATYYIFIANSKFGNGSFLLKINGLTMGNLILSILCTLVTYAILVAITYCIGIRFNMMITFIVALIAMYAGRYISQIKDLMFVKYTSFYMENSFLAGKSITGLDGMIFVIFSLILITSLMIISIKLFSKTDIK